MKQFLGLAVVCFSLIFPIYASDSNVISTEATVSQYIPATECYVVFLLESSGLGMTDAKANFDQKLREFSERCGKEFPEIKLDVISVNIGTRDFSSYRTEENQIAPTVAKVITCTLPPDENMAVKLLDFGIKSGLTPFCATSSSGNTFGAVYYGVKDPVKAFVELYPAAARELWDQATKLAEILKAGQLEMSGIVRLPSDHDYKIQYRDIKIDLPDQFCGGDKDKIKVSLTLRAGFKIKEELSGK